MSIIITHDNSELISFYQELYEGYTTKQLKIAHAECCENLQKHRANEPSKKRKKSREHSLWVDRSHDMINEIKVIRDELEKRYSINVKPQNGGNG